MGFYNINESTVYVREKNSFPRPAAMALDLMYVLQEKKNPSIRAHNSWHLGRLSNGEKECANQ